jgi:hypothetical protein
MEISYKRSPGRASPDRIAVLCDGDSTQQTHQEVSERMRTVLTNLVVRFIGGDSSALFEFPLILATTKERPLKLLLSLNFHGFLFDCLDSADDLTIDAVLRILSDLILVPSAEFLSAALFTTFSFRGRRVFLADFLENFLDTTDFQRSESILYLISQVLTVFPERLNAFSAFVVRCFGWRETQKVAAMISVFLIRNFPMSTFAAEVLPKFTFDGSDAEVSHHCFNAILAMLMCNPPNPACFEVGDMMRLAFTPMACDALRVLVQGTAVLLSKAEEVGNHVDELLRLFQEVPETRAHVSRIVSNCVSARADIARRFLPFVAIFRAPIFDDDTMPVKCEFARAIAATLVYSEVALDEAAWGEIFEMLECMLPMANAGMQSIVIDLLVKARWRSNGFREALEYLAGVPSSTKHVADVASLVLGSESYWLPAK